MWFKELAGIGDTKENLAAAAEGEIFDVDMDPIPDLLEGIHNTHGIEFVDYDISFKGICPKCREKK